MTGIVWLIAVVLTVPLAIYGLEMAFGFRRGRDGPAAVAASAAILIPAHDEAAGIEAMLTSLLAILPEGAKVLVVADNCSDDTAQRARALGAATVERQQPHLRGKGYALAHGREHLAVDPPEVVIVIDADCRFQPGSVERLAAAAAASGRPVQALNTLYPDLGASPLVQISNFAFLVKNAIRARGLERLGGATLLTGTGMAFPWAVFAAAPLATGSIVEDLELGIALTRQGTPARLLPSAVVQSASAAAGDLREQRSRWERGFVGVARHAALPTLAAGLVRRSRPLTFLGLHLLVPPMSMLILLSGLGLAATWLLHAFVGGPWLPVAILGGALLAALLLTLIAWLRIGRGTLSAAGLLIAPLYVLWKVPMYLGFLTTRPLQWRRSRRHRSV